MSTHSRFAVALAAVALAAAPRPAVAQWTGWEVGGFVGAHLFSPENNFGRDRDTKPDVYALQHNVLFGLRLGYFLIPRLGLEAELGFVPTATRGSPPTAEGEAVGPSVAAPVFLYRAHVVFHVLTGRLRPYLLAGFGGASLLSSNPATVYSDDDQFFHVGGGAKVDLDKDRRFGLRLDGRLLFPPSTTYWPERMGAMDPSRIVTFDGEVTLGLYGLFGAGPEPVAPRDSDGDGVPDSDDQCPAAAGPSGSKGCPAPGP